MRVGLLSERIVAASDRGKSRKIPDLAVTSSVLHYAEPRLKGVLAVPGSVREELIEGTSVKTLMDRVATMPRMRPPALGETISGASDGSNTAFAPLLRSDTTTDSEKAKTILAQTTIPATGAAQRHIAAGSRRGDLVNRSALIGISKMMLGPQTVVSATEHAARALAPGELAVFDMPGSAQSARFEDAGRLKIDGIARLVVLDAYGSILVNEARRNANVKLPARSALVAVLAGDESTRSHGEVVGWMSGEQIAYLGRGVARAAAAFIAVRGASRARGGHKEGIGWMRPVELTDQAALVETRFDSASQSVALLLRGVVTTADLSTVSLSFENIEAESSLPLLVPMDGKTLLVYAMRASSGPFAVHVGGQTPDRLEGVMAADFEPDRLVTRLVGETVSAELTVAVNAETGPVTLRWTGPADIKLKKGV